MKSIYDRTILAFTIHKGIVSFTDCLDSKNSKYSFTYNMFTHELKGKGSKTYFKNCERYVCFVLILLRESLAKQQKDQA